MGRKLTYEELEKRVVELEMISLEGGRNVSESETEALYRGLISEMIFGFALHEIVYDETGRPYDFRFLEVNPVCEKVIGLGTDSLVGKTVLEVFPQAEPYWLETYVKVALDGKPVFYENYSQELGKYFEVQVFTPQKGKVASLFKDITNSKQAEEALRKAHEKLEIRVQNRTEKLVMANLKLQAEISERQRAEDAVKASLKEKEVMLQEIHHRVKNNMQIIISLLMLQCENIEDKCYLNMFTEAMDRIKSMALVHEKLYRSRDFTKVDILGYVRSLVKNLIFSHALDTDKISLKIEENDVSLGLDSAIVCGLIINELVTNSLKYAFQKDMEGEIRIGIEPIGGEEIEIRVADNGVGMPDNFDIKNSDTLGLQIVTALAEQQLNGKVGLDSGNGTQFRIRFKDQSNK